MLLDGPEWQEFLHTFDRDAFRLETHPVYRMPAEQDGLRRFLAGEPIRTDETQGLLSKIRAHTQAGKTVGRVHIITRPLTDYLRFEFAHYRVNVTAGEEIRILDITGRPNPGLPARDFWMFDETRVVLMNYDAGGNQINRTLISDDPEPYVQWKHLAIKESVPFLDYVNDYPA